MSVALSRPAVADELYGLDAWDQNLLWIIDPADGSTIGGQQIVLPSGSIDTQNGMAVDPTTGTMYVIITVSGSTSRNLYTLASIPLTFDGGKLFIHPMSMLVTATGTGTATILLSGWNAGTCCDPELFSLAVESGSAVATQIGNPDSFFKGILEP